MLAIELAGRTGLPTDLQDERLSSREAQERLALRQRDWRKRKDRLDAAAAAVVREQGFQRVITALMSMTWSRADASSRVKDTTLMRRGVYRYQCGLTIGSMVYGDWFGSSLSEGATLGAFDMGGRLAACAAVWPLATAPATSGRERIGSRSPCRRSSAKRLLHWHKNGSRATRLTLRGGPSHPAWFKVS